jgi:8-oxo-dGTP pyrophosphatase MutT (NUDIX family)
MTLVDNLDPSGEVLGDVRTVLLAWVAPTQPQARLCRDYLDFIAEHPTAAASRGLRLGHLTASTLVLDHARERVLLTLHPAAGRWFQLGGHIEPGDTSLGDAALREATEESGIEGLVLDPTPIGLDRHSTRCKESSGQRSPSVHWDIEFLAVAPPEAQQVISDESLDLAWFALDDLPELADDVVRGLVARARELGRA